MGPFVFTNLWPMALAGGLVNLYGGALGAGVIVLKLDVSSSTGQLFFNLFLTCQVLVWPCRCRGE